MGVGNIIAGGLSFFGSRSGAKKAAEAQKQAAALQYMMYQQQRADTAPWREAGESALNQLSQMVQRGPGEFTESPDYQWRVGEGVKALERGAAARGSQLSGAEQKALMKFGQDYASTDYDNFLRRYYASLQPYSALSGLGQASTHALIPAGTQAAQLAGNALGAAGYYEGAGTMNSINAIANALSRESNAAAMMGGYLAGGGWGGGTPSPSPTPTPVPTPTTGGSSSGGGYTGSTQYLNIPYIVPKYGP